jgi:hypothetical protein
MSVNDLTYAPSRPAAIFTNSADVIRNGEMMKPARPIPGMNRWRATVPLESFSSISISGSLYADRVIRPTKEGPVRSDVYLQPIGVVLDLMHPAVPRWAAGWIRQDGRDESVQ